MSRQITTVLLMVLAEIDQLDCHPHERHRFKKFVHSKCLAAGITVVDKKERVEFARRLLDEGEPRPVIRDRLIVRFGIKRASAYNALEAALLSKKAANILDEMPAQ